jgi:uroporphyrinogen-III synthase
MSSYCRLEGRGVLVTRPAAQADGLCRLIEAAGGRPISFPTVEIQPAGDSERARALLSESWDIVLFVSRNAVEQALALAGDASALRLARLGAVGRATAACMEQSGIAPQLVPPSGFDSESLLALPALTDVAGRRVLIVRGEGGRAMLGDTLTERGAEVAFAEVYRRALPQIDAGVLIPQWQQSLGYVTASSDEVLANLLALIPSSAHPWLRGLPLAVLSERNAASAMENGFRVVAVAAEASDAGLCDAVCRLSMAAAEAR